jgi:formamidopyrimidine-DNA glycosylase
VPELPEVEVVRRDLEAHVSGHTITRVEVSGPRTVRRHSPGRLTRRLRGATLGTVDRRGKFLLLGLQEPSDQVLVVHLRMSGQLVLARAADPVARHTHAVLTLGGDTQLRFVDPRTFGELFVTSASLPELAHLGPDPLSAQWTWRSLSAVLAGRRGLLKPLLMDQRHLAGLGNIYSDEALFTARLRGDRSAGSLTTADVRRLHRAISTTLQAAIERRGSSLADRQYVDLLGNAGSYQSEHRVYAREGRPCPYCHAPIIRLRLGGRSSFLCQTCQS